MRSALLPLTVVAGLAAGWLLNDLLREPPASAPETGAGSLMPGAAATGPTLAGTEGRPSGGLAEEAGRAVRALERGRSAQGPASVRGLVALATLQAVAGSEVEFLRVAAQALAQGASLNDLLPALREFPPEATARLLAQLLDQNPTAAYDVAQVAGLLADGGLTDRALGLVKATLPKRSAPDAELLRLLLRLDPTEGPRTLFALEGTERWDADALGVLRALLIEAGQDRALVPFLNRALTARPGDPDLLRWLARVDPRGAEARLQARVRTAPEDGRAWSLLADLRRDAGDAAAAFEAYRRAAEIHPGRSSFRDLVSVDPVRGLELVVAWSKDSADDERLGALGETYLAAGQREEALRTFLRAHEHDPGDGLWIDRIIELDPGTAVSTLEAQIAAAPAAADADLLGRYGQALAAAGRRQDAFQQVLAAFQKEPDRGTWQSALAELDPTRALPVLDRHVRDHPGDTSAQGAYGLALAGAGRREEALQALEGAVAAGDAERWYQPMASLDADRALAALDRRARTESVDPDLWGLLGQQLQGRQRRDEARRAYEAAARLDPSNRVWAQALRDLR